MYCNGRKFEIPINGQLNQDALLINQVGNRKWFFSIVGNNPVDPKVALVGLCPAYTQLSGLIKEYNKSIFAVPGSIFNEYSKGTLHIIKEGACIVSSGFDIAENLGFSLSSFRDNPIDSPNFYDPESLEYKIYSMLQSDAMTVDELSRILSIPMDIINSKVTLMTLDGLLMEDAGKLFV